MIKRNFGRRNRGAWYIDELADDGSTIETWPVVHFQNIREWGVYLDRSREPVASQRWLDQHGMIREKRHVVFQRGHIDEQGVLVSDGILPFLFPVIGEVVFKDNVLRFRFGDPI
jgi:hypothetical protein